MYVCREVGLINNNMNKIWFKGYKWSGWLVPCSIEGFVWLGLVVVAAGSYLGSNLEAGIVSGINVIGLILTILIGLLVVVLKSKN